MAAIVFRQSQNSTFDEVMIKSRGAHFKRALHASQRSSDHFLLSRSDCKLPFSYEEERNDSHPLVC